MAKPIDQVTIEEFQENPVWEFDLGNEGTDGKDETWAKPCKKLPVISMGNRVLGTTVELANGNKVFAVMSNISLGSPERTKDFLFVSIFRSNEEIFHLARPFDIEYKGSEALADFLGHTVDEIFPIKYDISELAHGHKKVLKGFIEKGPEKGLSDDERMAFMMKTI